MDAPSEVEEATAHRQRENPQEKETPGTGHPGGASNSGGIKKARRRRGLLKTCERSDLLGMVKKRLNIWHELPDAIY